MPLCADALERLSGSFRFEIGRTREQTDGPSLPGRETLILIPAGSENMKVALTRDGKIFLETEGERYRLRWQENPDGNFNPTWQHRPSLGDHLFNSYEVEIRQRDIVRFRDIVGYVKRVRSSFYELEHGHPSEDGRNVLVDSVRVVARDIELLRPAGEFTPGDIMFRDDTGTFMVIVSVGDEDTWGTNLEDIIGALRVKRDVENDMDERIPPPEPLTRGVLGYSRMVIPVESEAFANVEVPDVP